MEVMETVEVSCKTASERIILRLVSHNGWLAIHEFGLRGISDCAASARLRELARGGKVVSRFREHSRYKEWSIRKMEIPFCDIQSNG